MLAALVVIAQGAPETAQVPAEVALQVAGIDPAVVALGIVLVVAVPETAQEAVAQAIVPAVAELVTVLVAVEQVIVLAEAEVQTGLVAAELERGPVVAELDLDRVELPLKTRSVTAAHPLGLVPPVIAAEE